MKRQFIATPVESVALLKRGLIIEYASLVWMTVEVFGAVLAGVFSGSVALVAFGGDSIIELLSSLTVLDHLRIEGKGEASDDRTEKTEKSTVLLLVLLIPVIGVGASYAFFTGVRPE